MLYYFNKRLQTVTSIDNAIIDDNYIEITKDQYKIIRSKISQCYIPNCTIVDSKPVFSYTLDEEVYQLKKKAPLQQKRRPLLQAFDIYKSNVTYGTIVETESQHNQIISWYHLLLELDEEAINNPPEVITKYL